ncbi:hypothetical protein EVAR_54496_1 [Eumeta japonica]|uniref:Uncharacterized protein n=1 Tax=Eumeta variegata TaxID=151549 RepID=A0A4C1YJF5_EUMVA|nr:hypothetical protein EVAR_54496_1 [Eumeta japonica]
MKYAGSPLLYPPPSPPRFCLRHCGAFVTEFRRQSFVRCSAREKGRKAVGPGRCDVPTTPGQRDVGGEKPSRSEITFHQRSYTAGGRVARDILHRRDVFKTSPHVDSPVRRVLSLLCSRLKYGRIFSRRAIGRGGCSAAPAGTQLTKRNKQVSPCPLAVPTTHTQGDAGEYAPSIGSFPETPARIDIQFLELPAVGCMLHVVNACRRRASNY